MLTVKKLKGVNASAAADYFCDIDRQRSRGDYFAGPTGEAVECPGAWLGKLAVGLGMSGDVMIEQLLRLLDGCHPETGERLVPFRVDRVAAHDLTFSAPKSVSAVWALAGEELKEAVEQAQASAVADAVAYTERQIALVRRGDGGHIVESAAEVLAVAFSHHTSRQTAGQADNFLPPDPQVHTHVLLPMARRHDGRIVAINSAALCYGRREIEAVYHTALATNLAELGFEIERGTGRGQRYFEVGGIPKELCAIWSSRHHEIAAHQPELVAGFRAQYGRAPDGNEIRDLSVRSRIAKGRSHPTPRTFWGHVGATFEITADTIDRLRTGGKPAAGIGQDVVFAELLGEDGLTGEHATFDTRTLRLTGFQRAAGLLTIAETEQMLACLTNSGELVHLGEDRWTTREMLALEAQVIAWRERRRGVPPPARPSATQAQRALWAVQRERGVTLKGDQLDAFRAMLTGRFVAVTGAAGVGKGVVLSAAAKVWRAQQRRVFAVAVAGATAQRLAADLGEGAQAMTLAGLVTRVQHGRLRLRPDDVIAIDEAGIVGTRQWAQLAAGVGDVPTVVALGDAAQLSPLSAGGLWQILAVGGPRLTEIRRSQLAWERDAWRALRGGDAAGALAGYAEHGHLSVTATRSDALHAAVDAWDADGRTGLIITDASNAERHRANHVAQQRRIACRELGTAALTITTEHGEVALRGADRVIFCTQWRIGGGVQRVENGTTAEVIAVNPEAGTLTVRTDEPQPRELEITTDLATDTVDLAYCAHVYKAQGATVDRAYVVAGGWQTHRENLYVACSRSRQGTHLFVDRESLGQVTNPAALAELAARGAHSRAKAAAHRRLIPSPVLHHRRRRPNRRCRVLTTRRPLVETHRRRQQLRCARADAKRNREEIDQQVQRPSWLTMPTGAEAALRKGFPGWVGTAYEAVTGLIYALH